jgi:hypothetical protein
MITCLIFQLISQRLQLFISLCNNLEQMLMLWWARPLLREHCDQVDPPEYNQAKEHTNEAEFEPHLLPKGNANTAHSSLLSKVPTMHWLRSAISGRVTNNNFFKSLVII